MKTPVELEPYLAAAVITAGDIAAVQMLVELAALEAPCAPAPLAWVAMCLAIRTPRDGHTCVDFADITAWAGRLDRTAAAWPNTATDWIDALATATPLVGTPGDRKPFILDGSRLYLARSLDEEQRIAEMLLADGGGRVRVLLGGPGTGKTTQVAKELIGRFQEGGPGAARIALAAPTGKAAARMTEAIKKRCVDEQAPPAVLAAIEAAPAITIHKLLGFQPHRTPRHVFGAGNPLPYDLVVVDEASMLSSSLMFRLLAALDDDAQLMLVGDPDQLASVDAGTVLGDIASSAARSGTPLASRTTVLKVRHRFGPEIGGLADAILAGDVPGVMAALTAGSAAVRWVIPGSTAIEALTADVVAHARRIRELSAGDAETLLATHKSLQVLCAHRAGPTGVAGWNATVERRLGIRPGDEWYAGRPVMATRNNRALGLFNGDVGIVTRTDSNRLEAIFGQPGSLLRLPVVRLEDVETVHAVTIHKSQGSEYGHAIVVLPDADSRLQTRELLYTGVTRAIERVTVVGSQAAIEAAVRRRIRRASGLASRL